MIPGSFRLFVIECKTAAELHSDTDKLTTFLYFAGGHLIYAIRCFTVTYSAFL